MKIFNALLLAAPLALAAVPADAAVFTFDLSGAYAAKFDIDTDLLAPPVESAGDYFLITDIPGMFGGVTLTAGSIQFSTLASNGGFTIELPDGDFRGFFGPQLFTGTTGMPIIAPGTFNLTSDIDGAAAVVKIAAAVPEPATWGMMIAGFAAIGFATRRRPATTTAVRFG